MNRQRRRWQPVAQQHSARRLAASEPGEVDRVVVERSFARFQTAPQLDRFLGFPDIFKKSVFGVKAPPAPGLEQFGEVVQPLFRKIALAGNDIAATRQVRACVYVMCHKTARKRENGRRRNRDESHWT